MPPFSDDDNEPDYGETDEENAGMPTDLRLTAAQVRAEASLQDKPVANAEDIPLFADSDKRGTNSAVYLKVTKTGMVGVSGEAPTGYKGQLPISSNEESIFNNYGDGIYTVELCNHRHKVLRSKENLKLTLGGGAGRSNSVPNSGPSSEESTLHKHLAYSLQKNQENHQRELARLESVNSQVTTQVVAQAKAHTELVTKSTEASAQREREFMGSMVKQNQDFFANMMMMQQQSFQQTMALLNTGHQMTMESMRASNERDANANNPMLMLEIFSRGLNLGREYDGPDKPEYLQAIEMGLGGLKDIKDLVLLKNGLPNPSSLPSGNQAQRTLPKGNSSVASNNVSPGSTNAQQGKKEPLLTKDELINMVQLKKSLHKRGIDLAAMLKDATNHYETAADDEIFNKEDEETSDETTELDDSSESRQSSVDD
jgi:hypothetical protein